MSIISKLGRKAFTLSLILSDLKAFRRGVNVHDLRKYSGEWLQELNIRTVLDIGANSGQSARLYRHLFPQAAIFAFEPLPECFERLMQGMKGDRNFKGFECALGASDGAETFNRSEMTQSSSFLPQLGSFKEAFPEVGSATSVPVRIRTLDGMRNEVPIRDNLLVKIDTQGFEDKVIAGGRATIRRARVAIIEVSFVPLYDGQPLFPDIYEAMKGLGHTFAGVLDVMRDPRTSRVLQADAVFMGGDAGNSG